MVMKLDYYSPTQTLFAIKFKQRIFTKIYLMTFTHAYGLRPAHIQRIIRLDYQELTGRFLE